MARPTSEEALILQTLAWNEVERLRERFSMRRMDEKKRVGALERLLPKLKRLTKAPAATAGASNGDDLSPEEQTLLDSLRPPTK
jgi:hypothetical protein